MKPNGTRARAHDEGLTLDQQNAVDLIAAGATDTEAAAKMKLNRVTVTRWRCYSPTFRATLAVRRREVWGAAADRLRALLPKALDVEGKPSTAAVWGGTWARDHRGAEMIRGDLEAAGIPYATDGPDGPLYADFHALRHSFLTLGGRSGIDLRTLQELAWHSKPELTARYSHRRLYDLTGAVAKLPNLVPTDAPETKAQPLRLTGTECAKPDNAIHLGVVPGVVNCRAARHQSASSDEIPGVRANRGEVQQTLEMQGTGASQHRPASIGTSEDDGTRTRNHRRDKPVL